MATFKIKIEDVKKKEKNIKLYTYKVHIDDMTLY